MNNDRVLAQRVLGFPAHPASAGLARRMVSETLNGNKLPDEVVDSAELLVSEVVTNAIVHARSDVSVTVSVANGEVRVEVSDHSPHLPSQRSHDHTAITGRGLALLDSLADSYGVRSVPDAGKVVWFTVSSNGHHELAGMNGTSSAPNPPMTSVLLAGVPLVLFRAWEQHAAALLRESLLVHLAHDETASDQAIDEIATVNEALAVLGEQAVHAVEHAGHIDTSTAQDLTLQIPTDQISRYALLPSVLDHALELAAAGELLTPTSQPEVIALRNWCCSEIVRQGTGLAPTRWDGSAVQAAHAPFPYAPQKRPPNWDTTTIDAATDALLAADDSNRIVAASESAARLLGWDRDELIGQRIVTIVPEGLRDDHIAGFTRYLVTGQRTIIGTPIRLPALRRDGSQVPVELTVDVVDVGAGRTVFVGRFDQPRDKRSG